jgi:hypothetical protein
MKYYLVLSLLFMFNIVHGQTNKTFKIKGEAVRTEVVVNNGNLDISKIKIENISNKAIYLKWETISNTFPKEWDCSMCQHGACQIGIPAGSEFKKLNSNEDGFIAIHVMPQKISGEGTVKFKVYDKNKPDDFEVITFNVTVK